MNKQNTINLHTARFQKKSFIWIYVLGAQFYNYSPCSQIKLA